MSVSNPLQAAVDSPEELGQDIEASLLTKQVSEGAAPVDASLDNLINVVLDSVELANRSATVATTSTENLLNAVDNLRTLEKRAKKGAFLSLTLAFAALVTALLTLVWSTHSISSRIAKTDDTLLAVGKRVVDMNTGLEQLKRLETILAEVDLPKADPSMQQIAPKLDTLLAELRKPVPPPAPEKPAKQDDAGYQTLLKQVRSLETEAQTQTRALAKLAESIAAARGEVANLQKLSVALDRQLASDRARAAQAAQTAQAAQALPVPAPPVPGPKRAPPLAREESSDYIQYPAPKAATRPDSK